MIGTTCLKRALREILVADRRHPAGKPGLRQRGDNGLGAQAVGSGPFFDRFVLVHAATRTVKAETLEDLLGDGKRGDEFADVRLGADGNGC
jgi:hypothetical protein